ncbi:MAG: hypothetical protein K6G33_08965 [Ruminococcus sp.]|uniref:hypothetical protein n=1 Tax=Ruminococcus sp. TaxID=41978 RepID=UPI0025D8B7B4|nr:hypothetical protein [Ruminococcus sp.]MCR5600852.1 hypothetical protein [Ruminococcus sp.]
MRRKICVFTAVIAASAVLLCGCGKNGYEDFVIPEQGNSVLTALKENVVENHYEGVEPTVEEAQSTETSADGLCTIKCMSSYYDITLDYEKGSYYDVGKAYGEMTLKVRADYGEMMEQYLFENISAVFMNLNGDYSSIKERVDSFYNALYSDYKQELDGFADAVSGDSQGIKKDGILSADEVRLCQFVPDALRGTACSAISLDGTMTASGSRISNRILEWQLGSENQLCRAHSLVHFINGSKTLTSVTYLGFFPILTAVSDDGVMISEYDVGSYMGEPYTYLEKRSYTYDMRYAVENYATARECVDFLVDNAEKYPYCVNVLATDENDALVAELVVESSDGTPTVRDGSSKLGDKIEWSDPHCVCVVNSFAADGNPGYIAFDANNNVRWKRYEQLFCGQKGLTTGRFKELITSEKLSETRENIRSDSVVHMVLADYDTKRLQAVLTGEDGVVQTPEFIDLGSWEYAR